MTTHAAFEPSGFFSEELAQAYDQRNSALAPIAQSLHFLTRLALETLPQTARVLCVGVGTGAEIPALTHHRPQWRFTGVDPSAEMLAVGRHRLEAAGVMDRCHLLHGYVDDVAERDFDVVISLLVVHFVKAELRAPFYRAIHDRLRPGGRFVSAEISCDLNGEAFPKMLDDWKQVQALMGATYASLAALPEMLRDVLSVLSAPATEALWKEAGFPVPVPFFQAFMIRGWHADKPQPQGIAIG